VLYRVPEEVVLERIVLDHFKDVMKRRAQVLARDSNAARTRVNEVKKMNRTLSGYPAAVIAESPGPGAGTEEYYDGIDQAAEVDEGRLQKIGGVTGLGLEHFTDLDRYHVMVDFLSEPSVFEKVGLGCVCVCVCVYVSYCMG
jgi:hypothetical protein